jgi:hypothetical protein
MRLNRRVDSGALMEKRGFKCIRPGYIFLWRESVCGPDSPFKEQISTWLCTQNTRIDASKVTTV